MTVVAGEWVKNTANDRSRSEMTENDGQFMTMSTVAGGMGIKIIESGIVRAEWIVWNRRQFALRSPRNSWICLIFKNKNALGFLFSLNHALFFQFSRKKNPTFFMKIAWFCQKYNARIVYIFWSKNKKRSFGSRICPKNSIFFVKITQIQEHFRENQAHSKHGRMWTFFRFFRVFPFFEKWSIVKGFSGQEEENLQQIYEKVC